MWYLSYESSLLGSILRKLFSGKKRENVLVNLMFKQLFKHFRKKSHISLTYCSYSLSLCNLFYI